MSMKKRARGTVLIYNQESGTTKITEFLEYGRRENMKLGTWNKVILKFELGSLQGPLGSPTIASSHKVSLPGQSTVCELKGRSEAFCKLYIVMHNSM